uniref:Uncharacterized protein n=1 Tax=Anguilla anguilla TaxID=7936 RepID=A0A0E9TYD3_ANGAN
MSDHFFCADADRVIIPHRKATWST